ncbi:MAG: hypothetical protein AAF739_12285 [Pseudomonadota bacterium]
MAKHSKYDASVLCAVAGIKPVTWRAWRNRHGFMADAEVRDGATAQGQRSLYTAKEIMVARMAVDLTTMGIPAADAIWFADSHGHFFFENWLDWCQSEESGGGSNADKRPTTVVAVRFGHGEKPMMSMHFAEDAIGHLFNTDNRPAAVIYIPIIAQEVFAALKELGWPSIATAEDAKAIMLDALVKGLRGEGEGPEDA